MRVCGIDIGKNGACVTLKDGQIEDVMRFSVNQIDFNKFKSRKSVSVVDVNKLLQVVSVCDHVFVEQVSSGSGQGVTSMFTFGRQFGAVLSVLELSGINYTLVRPSDWQKVVFERGLVKEYIADTKKRMSVGAKVAFNDSALLYEGKRKGRDGTISMHDGIVDASLIALYGVSVLEREGINAPVCTGTGAALANDIELI